MVTEPLQPTEPIVLDVGAAGKGYLVDIIATLLEDHDIYDYTIDASGDIKQRVNILKQLAWKTRTTSQKSNRHHNLT